VIYNCQQQIYSDNKATRQYIFKMFKESQSHTTFPASHYQI